MDKKGNGAETGISEDDRGKISLAERASIVVIAQIMGYPCNLNAAQGSDRQARKRDQMARSYSLAMT